MRPVAVFILSIALCGCVSSNEQSKTAANNKISDDLMREVFDVKYPNYKSNEFVRKEALVYFTPKFDSLLFSNKLSDIPMNVLKIEKNPHGKGVRVHLYTSNNTSDDKSKLSNYLGYDLISYVDDSTARHLDDKAKYYVKGKKFKRLDEMLTFSLVKQVYYGPDPEISADPLNPADYMFKMGVFFCEVESITETSK